MTSVARPSAAALTFFLMLLVLVGTAHADAVGLFDPELARLCGGSAHAPRCSTDQVGLACCALGFFVVAGTGVLAVLLRGRKEKQ